MKDCCKPGFGVQQGCFRGSKKLARPFAWHVTEKSFGELFWRAFGYDCGKSSALATTTKSRASTCNSTQIFTLEMEVASTCLSSPVHLHPRSGMSNSHDCLPMKSREYLSREFMLHLPSTRSEVLHQGASMTLHWGQSEPWIQREKGPTVPKQQLTIVQMHNMPDDLAILRRASWSY